MQAIQTTMSYYATLDTETRIVVQQRTSEIKALLRQTAQNIFEMGAKFSDVQKALYNKRPGFEDWYTSEGFKRNFVYSCVNVYGTFKSSPNFGELPIAVSALYLLSAPNTPESARIEAIARAEDGEPITHATAQGIVHDHNNPALPFDPADEEENEENRLTDYERRNAIRYLQGQAEDLGVDVVIKDSRDVPTYEPISDRLNYDGDEWKTPPEWINAGRAFLGSIDLDPASNELAQDIVQASEYYTKDENGLNRPWNKPDGKAARVWCNPPYSTDPVKAFAQKAIDEYRAGNMEEGLFLVNNCTDTGWFFELAANYPVIFSRGRVKFWYDDPEDKTPTRQGQALFYFGPRVAAFYEAFSQAADENGRPLAYIPNGRFVHADT